MFANVKRDIGNQRHWERAAYVAFLQSIHVSTAIVSDPIADKQSNLERSQATSSDFKRSFAPSIFLQKLCYSSFALKILPFLKIPKNGE